jgi:hypothetical protein
MTIGDAPPCIRCKHMEIPPGSKDKALVCAAFPEGIPDGLLYGDHSHVTAFPGDNGLRYDPLNDQEWEKRLRAVREWQTGK